MGLGRISRSRLMGQVGSTHPTHLAIVPPGDGDAVGGRGQIHEVSEVDGAAGPFGFHSRLI